ncbi:hypothetical protein [Clostridium perfringens]|uniref:hypothetical protein n=1 Tax=Clostridium perfringens TaxID=1502 RepID=UPI003D32C3CE
MKIKKEAIKNLVDNLVDIWIEEEELEQLKNDSFVKSIDRNWDDSKEAWLYSIEYQNGDSEEVYCNV